MNHHKGVEPPIIEKPLRSKVMKDVCKDSFDADFIDRIGENRQALYDVILGISFFVFLMRFMHYDCVLMTPTTHIRYVWCCVCMIWVVAANYM